MTIRRRIALLMLAATVPSLAAEPPELAGPYKLVARDFTGNGQRDLAIGFHDLGLLSLAEGNGRGLFQHRAITPLLAPDNNEPIKRSYNLTAGDLDGDHRPDLAVGCEGVTSHLVLVVKNQGDGSFVVKNQFPTKSGAKGVALADLDRDGRLDLLYTARGTGRTGDLKTGRLHLRRGLGSWQFSAPITLEAGISAYYVETADLDGDGFLDILVPNELGRTASFWISPGRSIFKNGAKMKRRTVNPSGFRINDVRARDFTGDGHLDILTANWSTSTVSLFPGRGDGTFGTERLMPAGKHCVFFAVADFDADRDLDFAVTHWTEDFTSVFLNDGTGHFAPKTDIKTGLGNYGILAFDANGDGHVDLITANYRHRSTSLLVGRGDGSFAKAITTTRSFRATPDGFARDLPSQ
ncbi:MAG: VCBS repeat-containing protein [Planctomycetota bacterium]|nr:VCBS repeat-containing protein [Planctomycetota bacterium]